MNDDDYDQANDDGPFFYFKNMISINITCKLTLLNNIFPVISYILLAVVHEY